MRLLIAAIVAVCLGGLPALAKPPQVLPEPMLVNLFALTEASAVLQICAGSSAYGALPDAKKKLLHRLQQRIDGMVASMAAKFDNDLLRFFEVQRDRLAANPDRIAQTRATYGDCGDGMFERMKWYVYDSRQKLEHFLSQLPDTK